MENTVYIDINKGEKMFENNFSLKERYELLVDILLIGVLFAFAFWVNHGIRISGLYMDDLYMWSCYGEQNFIEYVFPIGSTRFRPLYWFIAWIELGIIRNNISLIVPINIVFSAMLATLIYLFSKRLSNSKTVAFVSGAVFLASRFSYYNISQLLGLMEALALLLALVICYCLYTYILDSTKSGHYYMAVIIYIAICFTHERYMVYLPLFIFTLIIKKNKDFKTYLAAILAFIFVQLSRFFMIGTVLPAGTGGTDVADTITLKGLIKSALSQIAYIFGINAGPEHLNGIVWNNVVFAIKIMIFIAIFLLLIILIKYIIALGNRVKFGKNIANNINISLLFIGFIAGSIVSSSVTIRVEMRWVYTAYMFSILFLAYMYGIIRDTLDISFKRDRNNKIDLSQYMPLYIIIFWGIFTLFSDLYYRTYYDNIYIFPNQKIYNSLADETYGKYGNRIFGKKIYIIGNSYQMSDFTADTFFKVFDKEKREDDIEVIHISSIRDFGQVKDNMLILAEDTANNSFTDITDFVKSLKCEIIYGYYRDGWMDEEAQLNIMAGENGHISLELLYPGNITGQEVIEISVNKKEFEDIKLEENISGYEIYANPYEVVNVRFKNNFIMPDALEIRGDKKLSLIVNINSD